MLLQRQAFSYIINNNVMGDNIMQRTMPASVHDLLPIGTRVRVQNKRGVIVKAEYVAAHPCGVVPLHTIKFTHVGKIKFANRITWLPIKKPKVETANYSFISVEED